MVDTLWKILYWVPRIMAILLALFLAIFALDVFSAGNTFMETVFALVIHLIPTILILLALLVAWRKQALGATMFFVLGILYLMISRTEGWIISGPLFALAAFFLSERLLRKRYGK